MSTILPLFAIAVLTGLPAIAAANDASTLTPEMVKLLAPPGLYRFDSSESTFRDLITGRVDRELQDGKSGITTLIKDAETKPTVSVIQGKPRSICQHSGPPMLPKPPPSMPESTCKNLSATLTGNTVTLVAQCYNGRNINKITKIDENTWEYFHESHLLAGIHPAGARPMLEMAAANGTPEQRELARQLLRTQPQRDAEVAAQLAQVDADMARSARAANTPAERARIARAQSTLKTPQPVARTTGTTRWTRIGGHCGSIKSGPLGPVFQR